MHQTVASLVGPALYTSASRLTLLGWGPIPRRLFHLRTPYESAAVCWLSVRSYQCLQWAGTTLESEPQFKRAKWYCTSTRQYLRNVTGDSTLKIVKDDQLTVSDTTSLAKESERNYTLSGSTRTEEVNVLSSDESKIDESVTVLETNYTRDVGMRGGTVNSSCVSEEEVDLEELVKLEVELHRQEGVPVPSVFTPTQWEELLTKKSMLGRKKYLKFLFKNEMRRENVKKKKELKRKIREEKERERENNPNVGEDEGGHIKYGLWRNSIFLKILDTTMNQFYNSRVISAMMHGQPLVIDLGFDDHMVSRERQNCAYQIQMLLSENRTHADPFAIHLCNASRSADTIVRLEKYIPPLFQPEFPLIVTPESYLERFPLDQLVYLTPHCQEEMTHYDHNAVYIIGGIVDKTSGEPLTLAKAKKEGIRMQKLPFDRYLSWAVGGKSLALNHVVNILLDIKVTGDWQYSLRHVPNRKLRPPPTEEELQNIIRKRLDRQSRSRLNSDNYGKRKYKRY